MHSHATHRCGRHPGPRSVHHRHGYGRGGSRARRGDIRAAALALLGEKPMHGYEMIQEIEERSGGYWRPSAGSIYPTLQLLEDEGLIAGEKSEGKRRFALTDDGRAATRERAEESESLPWERVRTGAPPELVRLGHSVQQLRATLGGALNAADESQRARIRELLDETRRGIYAILAEEGPASPTQE